MALPYQLYSHNSKKMYTNSVICNYQRRYKMYREYPLSSLVVTLVEI